MDSENKFDRDIALITRKEAGFTRRELVEYLIPNIKKATGSINFAPLEITLMETMIHRFESGKSIPEIELIKEGMITGPYLMWLKEGGYNPYNI